MKTKKHYDPYYYSGTSGAEGGGEPYYPPEDYIHICGTISSPDRDYEVTNNWEFVTCKRCLKQSDEIDKNVKENEKAIVDDMGQMADWWEINKLKGDKQND